MSMDHADAVFFENDQAFEAWLVDNSSTASHVWMRMAKKGTGVTSIDWTTAVDVALCFGWIDGIARRLDDEWYVQRFTPRRARSVWSKINRERIERLTADGRMRPAGLAEVERAKLDGRWDAAYDSPATAVVPDDLVAALAARDLTDVYAALDGRNRCGSSELRWGRRGRRHRCQRDRRRAVRADLRPVAQGVRALAISGRAALRGRRMGVALSPEVRLGVQSESASSEICLRAGARARHTVTPADSA